MTKLVTSLVVLVLALSLMVGVLPTAAASPITIIAESGVSDAGKADVQAAADATLSLVRDTYGLELQRAMRVILTANTEAYSAAHVREFGVTKAEADRRARTTRGWTSGNTILMNMGNLGNRSVRTRILSHELVHQYQDQVCKGSNCGELTWMREATADVIAARVVESVGATTLAQYREEWRTLLAEAPALPSLSELHSAQAWYAALDKYGSDVGYRTADMAGLRLLELGGQDALLGFFVKLSEGDPESAFVDAFGVSLGEFEAGFDPLAGS